MKIIVDTCVWSLAFRRKNKTSNDEKIIGELKKLIEDSRVQMLGLIRQELLSGITSLEQFKKLKKYLNEFPDLPIQSKDHELAAEYFNTCRAKGIQGSMIDFFICAISINNKLPIFTQDKDFEAYSKIIPLSFLKM